jgi:hypothetical protein
LLPLLIKTTKLVIFANVEKVEDCNFKAMLKIFFKPLQQMYTLTGTSCQENVLDFFNIQLMLKATNVPYFGGVKNKTN